MTTNALTVLARRYGPWRGPTQRGFYNFSHKECGDTRYRFGVNLRTRRFLCFHCNARGFLQGEDFPAGTKFALPLEAERPTVRVRSGETWERISRTPRKRVLEQKAVRYLESRGISRAQAAAVGLGFSLDSQAPGGVVAPWYDDKGTLGGWQVRMPYEVLPGETKTLNFGEMGPAEGALYGFERVPPETPVCLAEGPYDVLSAERVIPTSGLLGSRLYEAQVARLWLRRKPPVVIVATDPDTFERQKGAPPKVRGILKTLVKNCFALVRVVKYPDNFGDLGARPDKTPHTRREIETLIDSAGLYRPGQF